MIECVRCTGKVFTLPVTDSRRVFFVNRELTIHFDIDICMDCGHAEFTVQKKYLEEMKGIMNKLIGK